MKEQWKDIPGYDGVYQVSNMGRVRSLNYVDWLGHHRKGFIHKFSIAHRNHCQIAIRYRNQRRVYSLHRLVASAFIPNPDNLPDVNHKDENPLNNAVDNLEWCTVYYNNMYNGRNERIGKKLEKPVYVFTKAGHRYIFRSQRIASRMLGLNEGHVHDCLVGKLNRHHGYTFASAECG